MHQSILPDLAVAAAAAAAARHEFMSGNASTAASIMSHTATTENSLLRGLDSTLGSGGIGLRQPVVPPHLPPPHLSSLLHTNSQTHRELIQHQLQLHHHHQQQQLQGNIKLVFVFKG